jgi:plastocyanin
MIRKLTTLVALAVAGLVTATVGFGRADAVTTVRGSVGPGFTINLTKAGARVKTLKAGTYRFVVSDRSAEHNFVLRRGSSVRQLTSVPFVGTKTVTVKLARGAWTFFCAPHASAMFGSFRVGAANTVGDRTTTADDRGGHGEPEPGDDHGRGGHGRDG